MSEKRTRAEFGHSASKVISKQNSIFHELKKKTLEENVLPFSAHGNIYDPPYVAELVEIDSDADSEDMCDDIFASDDLSALIEEAADIINGTDETSLKAEEGNGLPIIRVNKRSDEMTRMDMMVNSCETTAIYEVADIEFSENEVRALDKILFTYKNTKCELIVDDETVFFSKNGSFSKAIIRREGRYIKCLDDPDEYPLDCLCFTDDYYYSIFDDIQEIEGKVNAMKIFSRLSSYQQDFIISMSKRPKIDESTGNSDVSEGYSPIRDEKALRMMYQLCRSTYKPSVRARADSLFEQLPRTHGTDHMNLLNQIAYTVGIDTSSFPQNRKTFDEIIEIMDKHIYGMSDLKVAIAEFIIAMQYSGDPYCAILLVGPPGVGKTSVTNAIVECLGIPLVHIDCFGVDIITMSGLIKAYSGAKASKVMDGFYEAGRTDVVMLFDEIDKMEKGKEGDPYGALIKPLGPQRKYYDEYVAGDTDVSATKFIATANDIKNIPGYILNRFEGNVFEIAPYTVEEKVEIARNHIVPKKLAAFNISSGDIEFSDDALYAIAKEYCNDEGARELSGHITNLIRKVITEWSRGIADKPLRIDEEYVHSHITAHNTRVKRKIGF